MPFITEELWVALTGGESLVVAQWPVAHPEHSDAQGEKLILQVQEIVTEVRRFRSDQGIKTSQRIPARFVAPATIEPYESAMRFVLKLDSEPAGFTPNATVEIGKIKVELDMSGTVDLVAERARLTKDLATAQKDLATAQVKLTNENFMAKAPDDVVVEIKERLVKTQADIDRISSALKSLPQQ